MTPITTANRVDGRLKVTGGARYAAEFQPDQGQVLYAALVQSTIAAGGVASIDTARARRVPGVVEIMTHENAPRLDLAKAGDMAPGFPLLQDDKVLFNGQHLAVVIADTFEAAQQAAVLVEIHYNRDEAVPLMSDAPAGTTVPQRFRNGMRPPDSSRGTPQASFDAAAVKIDQTYRTPVEHHNPMEPHATMAEWQGGQLLLHNASQSVFGNRKAVAGFFGLAEDQVRVVNPFVGGGFGTKGSSWPHITLAAMAAKMTGKPVKLVLTRRQMFTSNGYRPKTVQHVRLGAGRDGRLTAVLHDGISQNSCYGEFSEPVALASEMLYSCPNVAVSHRLSKVNQGLPTFMRAPGEASGVYALESAMDELAWALGMDPVELRLKNYAERDEHEDKPFSSKTLRACYEQGAAAFDWHRRVAKPRSMRDGRLLIGFGMATATYPANRSEAAAKVRLHADGTAVVQCGSQDIGTGTYTVMAQLGAEYLGLPLERVRAELGDTSLPQAPVSGGSQSIASIAPAIREACLAVRAQALQLASQDPSSPLSGIDVKDLDIADGRIIHATDTTRGESYQALLGRQGRASLDGAGSTKPGEEKKQFSMHSFGAQFVEVSVDPDLGEVRVRRHVGAFAAGRIMNAKTARSQMIGGIVFGVGMALTEATEIDARSGRVTNATIADYLVPVHLDVPEIEVIMVAEQDDEVNPLGAKGIGELPMVGTAAAIANAVYHATGQRIRDLPIRPDKLIEGLST
ncbi:MAG TPA: xanthine dehydrogenase family protein molybdopterin-binding subunit [Aliidongia sp.]|uniref:xanthine dehydrogenase family protein molybdopterin-binding subunit n=1 Tax=Aliidongia sp. TaxID=1914230 RepID=UPI002DDD7AA2|nr:xanthine dehydrogenase family protein molybdopterin-binding subunit [Aliidongia sp.]HEV2673256.1 xanthine dehydrogenase family protein molybdopterin-binding subunit [Aliidongia sp.]